MDTTTTDNAIENKKQGTQGKRDLKGFGMEMAKNVGHIVLYFIVIGSLGLYMSKLAQANVVPDSVNYMPFGEIERKVNQIPVNFNVVRIKSKDNPDAEPVIKSIKMLFDSAKISESYYHKGIIEYLNKFKDDPKMASSTGLYFRDIIVHMIALNNYVFNKVFGIANENLSESAILLLWGFIGHIFYGMMFTANIFLCGFMHIYCVKNFFKTPTPEGDSVSWSNAKFSFVKALMFMLYALIAGAVALPVFAIFVTGFCILSPIGITFNVEGSDKVFKFIDFVKNVLVYKGYIFLMVLSYYLIKTSQVFLDQNATIGIFIAILIVAFAMHLYEQKIPENDANMTEGEAPYTKAELVGEGGAEETATPTPAPSENLGGLTETPLTPPPINPTPPQQPEQQPPIQQVAGKRRPSASRKSRR